MKVKRQKLNRRHVRFYKVCFGFRDPYKVLCDGNFLHHVYKMKGGGISEALQKLLGAPAKPLVTRCIMAELKKLGPAFEQTLGIARQLNMTRCEHEPAMTGGDCLRAVIGTTNSEHLWLASQDVNLRKHVRKVPGGALIYANQTALVLEPPSEEQQKLAKLSESERLSLAKWEEGQGVSQQWRINRQSAQRSEASKQFESFEANQSNEYPQEAAGNGEIGGFGVSKKQARSSLESDKPTFKRKRVKGPNPLSIKKKKKTPGTSSDQNMRTPVNVEEKDKRRKRVRARKPKPGSTDSKETQT